MHDVELDELVRLLQAHTPLERLSNMEARTVFEFMAQRGHQIIRKNQFYADQYKTGGSVD